MSLCYSCVATILSDVNCESQWVLRDGVYSRGGTTTHRTAYTPADCQMACEFDPRCVAVDWMSDIRVCLINTKLDHRHSGPNNLYDHYELISRCNITPGQCFDSSSTVQVM